MTSNLMDIRNQVLLAAGVAAAGIGGVTPLAAQLPQASASALGMGYNTTASTRGFAAVANNPAGLGMDDSPGFSLAVPAIALETGLGPVTLADLADWEGRLLPASVKDQWLESVGSSGGQGGSAFVSGTPVAASIGPLGLQLSTHVGGELNLDPDAVELLLYGNAGRSGSAGDFTLEESSVDAFAVSTAAVAYGFRATGRLHLGVTGTYSVGHGLVVGRDAGTMLSSDPLSAEIRFPMLFSDFDGEDGSSELSQGSGVGLDVGAIYVGPSVTIGATIQNVVSTFEWDVEGFRYVPGEAVFDRDLAESDWEERPATEAPQGLLDAAGELTLKPVYAVGVELQPNSLLRLTADIRKRTSGGLRFGPDFHAGVGAELTLLSFLPVRAHVASVTGGAQVGGGASLVLGPVNVSGAGALRTGDFGDSGLGMVTLSFGAN